MSENHFGSHFWPFQIDRPFWMSEIHFWFLFLWRPFWTSEKHFGSHFWQFQIDRHFGCPKFTYDGISGHIRSIRNFIYFLKFWQNGRRWPFWMSANNFVLHFCPFQNFMYFLYFFDKMAARGHFGWDDNVNYETRPRYLDE